MARDLRLGGILLSLASALYVSALIGRGASIDPTTEPAAFAQAIGSTRGAVSALVYVFGMLLHVFAVLVIVRGAGKANPRFAVIALVMSITALVGTVAVVGPFVYTWPAIAQSYLAGNTRAMEIVPLAAGSLFVVSVLLGGVLLTTGSIFLSRVLSKAGVPQWIALSYAISAPLYATPIPGYPAEILGSLLLLAAGVGLARTPRDQGDSPARA